MHKRGKKIKIGGAIFVVTCIISTIIFIRAAIRARSGTSALYHSPYDDPFNQMFFKRRSAPTTGKFDVLLHTELPVKPERPEPRPPVETFVAKLPGFKTPLLVFKHKKSIRGIDYMGQSYNLLTAAQYLYEIVKLPGGLSGFLVEPGERGICAPKLINFKGQQVYSLQRVVKRPAGIRTATVRDLDHDGHLEVIMAVSTGYELQPRGLYIHDLASGQRKSCFNMGCYPLIAAFADVNSDGKEEIILETYGPQNGSYENGLTDYGEGYVLLLDSNANLLAKYTFFYYYIRTFVALADVDKDGRLEIICTTGSWFRNWGRMVILTADTLAPLTEHVHFPASLCPPAAADIDNDGWLDIVTGSYDGNLYVFDHRLQKKYSHRFSLPGKAHQWFPVNVQAVNDLDGDGELEIIITTRYEDEVHKEPSRTVVETGNHKILILSPSLEIEQEIPVQGASDVIIADFIPGGSNELIINHPSITVFQAPTNPLYHSPLLPLSGALCSILALFLFFFIRHIKKSKFYALQDRIIKRHLNKMPKLPPVDKMERYSPYSRALSFFYFNELFNFCGWEKNQPLDSLRERLQTRDFWAREIDEVVELCKRFNQADSSIIPSFDELQELHEWVKRVTILFFTGKEV